MDVIEVKGGAKLKGSVRAAGAKNAMTKLLVASLLSDKKSIFYNVPNIGDVEITVNLCKEIGSEVHWDRDKRIIEIQTKELKTSYIPQRFCGANRIPILMMGALLGRTTEDVMIPTVGGDDIGVRSVDFHIEALQKLGATIEFRQMRKEGAYLGHAHNGLSGNHIHLPYPSIGATENAILGAVRAKGHTTITNAATEPEIVDVILFLQKMGAHIHLDANRTIRIEGNSVSKEVEHTVLTDRIEAASWGMVAIASQGRVFVERAQHAPMLTFLNRIRDIGGGFQVREDGIEFFYDGPLKGGAHIETDVHPGFMTDWQQPFGVLLTQAQGTSVVHETVYDNRFGYTLTIKEMGADIELFKECLGSKPCRFAMKNYYHSIIVRGKTQLVGKEIAIPDLRAGFAYVMAALIAKGTSYISGAGFLDRGYEELVPKLQKLGADIQRIQTKPDTTPLKPIRPPAKVKSKV
ncbi:MAG: UDP-N-acetylglucosamine 1-carboxyvinyltransferase 1 [Chlamydiales bacterium]|nr:UDP-N-acetylglucosamine 1-carboxyvinyltransferase 1 [Chlamydiales bacterium]MCH9635975.1 UDP-N-acetylglucosamine 1-carboxyvinyltransferase 1 [Chlamydiales bacterium]MCH9704449.1 UDP-N-acetylglucosamine 1-carboxyvinyltransferase [Chlamydiota bacterium]